MPLEQIIGSAREGSYIYQVWGREKRPQIGELAPDIPLVSANADGSLNIFRLSDYIGRKTVVLAWMNAAFTGTCQDEICDLDKQREVLLSTDDVEVITLSTDLPWAQYAWKEANNIDPKHTVAHVGMESVIDYGRGIKVPVLFSQRGTDVIDLEGILRFSQSYDEQDKNPDLTEPISFARQLSSRAKGN